MNSEYIKRHSEDYVKWYVPCVTGTQGLIIIWNTIYNSYTSVQVNNRKQFFSHRISRKYVPFVVSCGCKQWLTHCVSINHCVWVNKLIMCRVWQKHCQGYLTALNNSQPELCELFHAPIQFLIKFTCWLKCFVFLVINIFNLFCISANLS